MVIASTHTYPTTESHERRQPPTPRHCPFRRDWGGTESATTAETCCPESRLVLPCPDGTRSRRRQTARLDGESCAVIDVAADQRKLPVRQPQNPTAKYPHTLRLAGSRRASGPWRGVPDSSRKISRRGSTRRIHLKNAARFAATSGLSHSLGRGRFCSTRTHRGAVRGRCSLACSAAHARRAGCIPNTIPASCCPVRRRRRAATSPVRSATASRPVSAGAPPSPLSALGQPTAGAFASRFGIPTPPSDIHLRPRGTPPGRARGT
jgi:hypothetical protein